MFYKAHVIMSILEIINLVLNIASITSWIILFVYIHCSYRYLKVSKLFDIRHLGIYYTAIGIFYIYLNSVWLFEEYDETLDDLVVSVSWAVFEILVPIVLIITIHTIKVHVRKYLKVTKDIEQKLLQ